MHAHDLTLTDLTSGDLLDNTESGEVLRYRSAYQSVVKFDRLDEDGEVIGWLKTGEEEAEAALADGRYQPREVAALQPGQADLDLGLDADTDVYLRFGDLPEGERSTNHIDGSMEAGVSVYAATDEPAGDATDTPVMFVPTGNKLQQILFLAARDTYLVTGEEVGTGTDGEPLLRDIEAVAKLRSPKGVGGWIVEGDE